jgi:hypothetical protein
MRKVGIEVAYRQNIYFPQARKASFLILAMELVVVHAENPFFTKPFAAFFIQEVPGTALMDDSQVLDFAHSIPGLIPQV